MRTLKDYIDDTTVNCRLSDKQESAILSAFELYLNDLEREQKGGPTISDEIIQKWADKEYGTIHIAGISLACKLAVIKALKALQSGEIARWAKENGT